MFVPLPTRIGEEQYLDGDFTIARVFRMQSSEEVERRVGYREGRLSAGYWLMFLTVKPTETQFEYRGMTYMSGGRIQGHLAKHATGPTAEQRLRADGINLDGNSYQKEGLKKKTIEETFALTGAMRLAKVRPVLPPRGEKDIPDYPPGTGFPQWTLIERLPWVAAAFIGPGASYSGNYD